MPRTSANRSANLTPPAPPEGPPTGAAAPATPPVPTGGIPIDDIGRMRRFRDWLDGDLLYIYSWKQWASWSDNGWTLDASSSQSLSVMELVQDFADFIMEEAETYPEGAQRNAMVGAARAYRGSDGISAVIKLLKPHVAVKPTDFDCDPFLLGVQNGVVDIRTGEHRETEKDDMILKKCSVNYNPDAKCPMWREFLEQVLPDADVRAFLQRAIGYSLTGMTTEQVLFFLYGLGQNGKSTFIETIERLLGPYSFRAAATLFLEAKHGENVENKLAQLPEKRFVVGAEMPDGAHLAEARIKDLTGGDTIYARKLFCEPFNFKPTHKLFFYGNHKPIVRGTDQGIWRRLLLIPFTVEIPPEKRDRKIVARLWAESEGILNWAIEGALEWQEKGLQAPDSVRTATAEYREDEDLILQFIEGECELGPDKSIKRSQLSAAFELWMKSAGYKFTMSPRAVSDRVRRIPGVRDGKVIHGIRSWHGITLKDPKSYVGATH